MIPFADVNNNFGGDFFMAKFNQLVIIIMLSCLISLKVTALAQNVTKDKSYCSQIYTSKDLSKKLLHVYGEINSITPDKIQITNQNGSYIFNLSPETEIFCNSLSANWSSLRPVTVNAFFEADLYVNRLNNVVLIKGFYRGEECFIRGWVNKEGSLKLNLVSEDQGKILQLNVNKNAVLPSGLNWLQVDQVVYILYNIHGEIRAIYLPD